MFRAATSRAQTRLVDPHALTLKLDRDAGCDAPERDVVFVECCSPTGLERAANVAKVASDAQAIAKWEQDPHPDVAGW